MGSAGEVRLTRDRIVAVTEAALIAAGATPENARPVAESTAAAEFSGMPSHGLLYVPIYAEHVRVGKVDGRAVPSVALLKPALLGADARSGFAHPAIAAGFERLIPLAQEMGIAALAVRESYNCGLLGYHTDRLALEGLIGIGFTNAPASIAPAGGTRPVLGTNPFAIAVPDGQGGVALSIDQSASVVAKSEVMKRSREGAAIPVGWALDSEGHSTTDAALALKGSMAPLGGYKGVGLSLFVELLAAAATGATLGIDASPFSGPVGGPAADRADVHGDRCRHEFRRRLRGADRPAPRGIRRTAGGTAPRHEEVGVPSERRGTRDGRGRRRSLRPRRRVGGSDAVGAGGGRISRRRPGRRRLRSGGSAASAARRSRPHSSPRRARPSPEWGGARSLRRSHAPAPSPSRSPRW